MKNYIFLLTVLLLMGCRNEPQQNKTGLVVDHAMVVSAREEASKIGADILKQGGNAFDAMVATEMALAVAYPFAGNLGGGGFMVYRNADGSTGALDYREKAPMAAHKDMYLDEAGNPISDKSRIGSLAVGVPGTVAGIFAVHKKLGSMPMAQLLKPVIELAQRGYVVTKKQAKSLGSYKAILDSVNGKVTLYSLSYTAGDTIKNPALANTLKRIAEHGKNEFYKGQSAKILVDFLSTKGGIIT